MDTAELSQTRKSEVHAGAWMVDVFVLLGGVPWHVGGKPMLWLTVQRPNTNPILIVLEPTKTAYSLAV